MSRSGDVLQSATRMRTSGKVDTRKQAFAIFFQKVSRNFREFFEVFARFSKFSDVFGPIRTCSDLFGPVRMHSDASGCVQKRSDAFGKLRKFWSEKCDFCISGRDFDRLDLFLTSASATGRLQKSIAWGELAIAWGMLAIPE